MADPISDDEALRRRRHFLREVHRPLRQIDKNPPRAIPRRHHDRMHAAWTVPAREGPLAAAVGR